jgi:hypothetical protein
MRTHHRFGRIIGLWPLGLLVLLATGCDGGLLNFNIYIPLGLSGGTGILNPTGQGVFYFPSDSSTVEPPIPTQIGDITGGTAEETAIH